MSYGSVTDHRQATIIGGSIAGLTTGIALLRCGWDVHIFEATKGELQQRGAGIITHQALFDVLQKLGISHRQQIGVQIQTRKMFARDGKVTRTLEMPQIASSWATMYQLLKESFPTDRYHQDKVYERHRERDNRVEIDFTDGTSTSSDLLVAADGIRSTIRQQLEPDAQPEYAGYVAWRGLIEEKNLGDDQWRELFPYFTFCLPDGEQVLSYPIAGKQHQVSAGMRCCNVVWYRPAAKASTLQALLTDVNGDNNGISIAPDKIRPDVVERMQADASELLSPQHQSLIENLEQPFIQPIYDLTTQTMVHRRVVILGDAAFTARPHLGVGITKAAEDAYSLASALETHNDPLAALEHFNRQRQETGRTLVYRSRELGAYLQAQLVNENERRFANLHRTAEAVMQETANPQAIDNNRL